MCLLCDDEAAYRAYMDYLDAQERKGAPADPDKAVNDVLDKMQASAAAIYLNAPENDKTLSPFFCSPVLK